MRNEYTKKQAIELYETKFWETMSFRQIAEFQMMTKKLCMPFNVFHKAMEETLGRPVYTHEFGLDYDGLLKELIGEKEAPTLQEIINLIPEEKRIIVFGDEFVD